MKSRVKAAASNVASTARQAGSIILIGVLLGVASWFIPVPVSATSSVAFHAPLFIETLLATISVGAGWLFLVGLTGFKVRLRVAYTLIALGMVIYALALVQLPILQAANLLPSTYVSEGWLNILYDIAGLLLLLGFGRCAKLMQAPAWPFNLLTILVMTALALASALLINDHISWYPTLSAERVNVALTAVTAGFLSLTAAGILLVKQAAGPTYVNALAWSFVGVSFLALATISTLYFQVHGWTGFYVLSGLFFLPFLAGVLGNLQAALAFNSITQA